MPFKFYAELAPQSIDVYDAINDTTATVTIPTLVAGSIDQTSPDTNSTLTVSGSNETEFASYQWQSSQTSGGTYSDVSGATSNQFDPSLPGFYRRGVSDGAQGFVYTSPVEVTAGTTYAETLFDVGGSLGFTTTPTGPFYTNVAGTTSATDTDSVAKWTDLGTDTDITQSDGADQPTLRDTGGVTPYLEFTAAHSLDTNTQPADQGTIAIRFKSLDGTSSSGALGALVDSGNRVQVFAPSSGVQFRLGNLIYAPSPDLISDQSAHTIALTWDNTAKTYKAYIDGSLIRDDTFTGNASPATNFIISQFSNPGAYYATLVLNRRLTDQEIINLENNQWGNYT